MELSRMTTFRWFVLLLHLFAPSVGFALEPVDWILPLGGKIERDSSSNVVAINLRGSWVSDTELMTLASLPYLERLDLSHTRISDEGMLLLKSAPRISDLNLYYAEQITDQGMAAIKDWKRLKRLSVRGTRISDGTLEIVSHLTQLEVLDIANTPVTDNGLDYLITLTSLKELSLGRRRLGDNLIEVLRLLPTLTYLDLSGPRSADRPDIVFSSRSLELGAMDERATRAISELKNLRVLKLGYSNISADGLRILGGLNQLEKLGLEACARIDDDAATELANWKSLKYVDLQETKVTPRGLDALRRAKPGLVILAQSSAVGTALPRASTSGSSR
jgi:internalin A